MKALNVMTSSLLEKGLPPVECGQDFIEPCTWRYSLLWWSSFAFPEHWTTSLSRDWTLILPLCNPKLLSTEWAKNVAKILLSHAHECIVSCDDPPLFSLYIGQLVLQGIEPLSPHSAIQSFCQLNEQTYSLSSIVMYCIRLSHLPSLKVYTLTESCNNLWFHHLNKNPSAPTHLFLQGVI